MALIYDTATTIPDNIEFNNTLQNTHVPNTLNNENNENNTNTANPTNNVRRINSPNVNAINIYNNPQSNSSNSNSTSTNINTSSTQRTNRSNTINVTNSHNIQSNIAGNNTQIINTPRRNRNSYATNIATKLEVLNIRSLYQITLINEFYKDSRFLKPLDHAHNTRQRAKGRYKVERHTNNYGKNSLHTTLPNVFNKVPTELLNIKNPYKRKFLLKKYFINTQ